MDCFVHAARGKRVIGPAKQNINNSGNARLLLRTPPITIDDGTRMELDFLFLAAGCYLWQCNEESAGAALGSAQAQP
jgi:hypothetical protein